MKYVDLGKIQPKITRKKASSKHKAVKVLIWTLILVLVGYVIFSVKPIVEKGIKSFWQGPATVLSFLRNNTNKLDQDEGRTNFLLLGIDKRSEIPYSYKGENGQVEKNGFLSDTIIVGSFRHSDASLVLFSVPRDLWVEVPAFGGVSKRYAKINAAYSIGDTEDYPGGGLGLSRNVCESILDIPIHYTFRIDFEGFRKAVDLIGGIDVNVENAFDDYMYPREGYENAPNLSDRYLHVHFEAGTQHLDGTKALEYVRSRYALGVEGSDFARAKRQQKVILAARDKALSLSWMDSPNQIKEAFTTFGEMVQTDAPLSDFPLFLSLVKKLDLTQVKTYILGSLSQTEDNELLYNPPLEQFGGAWVLIPKKGDWSEIQSFVRGALFATETE